MQSVDDKALIERCRQGDGAAWDKLYRHLAPRIRGVVGWSRWGFSRHEVDDFVQEVFLELSRSLDSFRGEASLLTFVLRLARNKCVSHLRRTTARKRGREAVTVSIDEAARGDGEVAPRLLAIDGARRPDEQVLHEEQVATLLRHLDRLSPDCQTIIRLRYGKDQAYDEICRTLGLPLGTVCSRLKRCLDRLRTMLEGE